MAKEVEEAVNEYPKMVYPHKTGDKVVDSGPGFVVNNKAEEDDVMNANSQGVKPTATQAKPKAEWGGK